ncbi:MAG: hypothetical protein HYV63_09255 [Candidatus Schekmanbacteria bacterium]|nr:hypothetical protein [Candidatus Schekmanbacteria bacterium]
MTEQKERPGEETPLGQRLLDRPFVLLVAGVLVMLAFYTLWGIFELVTLPTATLP